MNDGLRPETSDMNRWYAGIVESANAAIVGKDLNSRITSFNESAAKLFGYSRDEAIGQPITILIPHDRQDEEVAIMSHIRQGEAPEEFETIRRRKDGSLIPVSLIISPIKDSSNRIIGASKIARRISSGGEDESALRISEERFRRLADNIAQFAWMADAQGELFWYNQRWFEYTGSTFEEMAGSGWKKVHHTDHVERVTLKWRETLKMGCIWEDTFPLRSKDGQYRWFLSRAVPVRDSHGKIQHWIGTNTDITEQRNVQVALERARDLSEEASRAKDDFLAAFSHELRTPLNPVLLIASEAANNADLTPAIRDDFEAIRKNVELEARLIDDLLDLTHITRGKLFLELRPLNPHDVLRDAIVTVQADILAKQIQLVTQLNAGDQIIFADAVRLQQIIWNVLKNAIKFTPEGGKITAETLLCDGQFVLKISDNGWGLTPEEIGRLFQAFSQGDHAGNKGHRFGGLGLGLAISRKLAEIHGGEITVESKGRACGATFIMKFPLAGEKAHRESPADKKPSVKSPAAPQASKSGLRILLVEDHEPTRFALIQLLTRRHYQVTSAGSVAEAQKLAAQEPFDFVISDIGLPDGDGNTLMAELRDHYGLKGIALTGYGMERDIARSHASGFVTHLTKPIRVESLEIALADLAALKNA